MTRISISIFYGAVGTLPENALLVTMDVSSLYSNIPHEDGIEACIEFLRKDAQLSEDTMKSIKDLLTIVLTKNHFQFGDENYLQVSAKQSAIGESLQIRINLQVTVITLENTSRIATTQTLCWTKL